jgi:hypothetical protein
LDLSLEPASLSGSLSAQLTLTDTLALPPLPGQLHTLIVTGTYESLVQAVEVRLLVGGGRLYLPLVVSPE